MKLIVYIEGEIEGEIIVNLILIYYKGLFSLLSLGLLILLIEILKYSNATNNSNKNSINDKYQPINIKNICLLKYKYSIPINGSKSIK